MNELTLNQFQELSMRTAKPLDDKTALIHGSMGLASEAGELCTPVKAHVIYGKPLDKANIKEELGDLLWFVQYTAKILGWTLQEVADENLAKLRARYPDKYSDVAAVARMDKLIPTTEPTLETGEYYTWLDWNGGPAGEPPFKEDIWVLVEIRENGDTGPVPYLARRLNWKQTGADTDIVRYAVLDMDLLPGVSPWVKWDSRKKFPVVFGHLKIEAFLAGEGLHADTAVDLDWSTVDEYRIVEY